MDKFGIFNLLNSFFPLNTQKNEQTPNNNFSSNDLLTNLLSSFTTNSRTNNVEEKQAKNAVNQPPHPLQEQMLLTVSKHDAIVKRVKEKPKTF